MRKKQYSCFSILWCGVYLFENGRHGTSDSDRSWCETSFYSQIIISCWLLIIPLVECADRTSSFQSLFPAIPFIKITSVYSLLYGLCFITVIVGVACTNPHECHFSSVRVKFSLIQRFIFIIFLNTSAFTTTMYKEQMHW